MSSPATRKCCGPRLAAFDGKTKWLNVSHAFHSPLMRDMVEEFGRIARLADYHPAVLPIVSTVTGEIGGHDSADYWIGHVEAAVRFADAARTLRDAGCGTYLELGPDGVLSALVDDGVARPLLRRDRPEVPELLAALGTAHVRGVDVDFAALAPGGRRIDLPTYPFQRSRFWLTPGGGADARGLGLRRAEHPLLGAVVPVADGDTVFTARLSAADQPWLAGHRVGGEILFPGTGFLELALHAGAETGCPAVEELTLGAPLVLSAAAEVQVVVSAEDDGRRTIAVHSRPETGEEWTRHASGTLTADVAFTRKRHPARPGRRRGNAVSWTTTTCPASSTTACSAASGPPGWTATTSTPRSRCPRAASGSTRPCWTRPCTHSSCVSPRSPRAGCRSRGPACACTRATRRRCGCGCRSRAGTPCRSSPSTTRARSC